MLKLPVSAKHPRAIALCVAFAVLLATLGAHAQSDEERSGARAAAQEGASAFREKRWSDAIDLFTRAESLVHSPMHVIFMARAHANLNKLVKARELYLKVIREPLGQNAPKAFQNAQDDAQKELNELEPKLPYVTVQVEGAGAETVSVTQDGIAIPPALIGVPRPVDPGDHEFQALTQSLASRSQKVTVAEKTRQTVALKLEPRSAVAAPPVTAPPPAGTGETPAAGTPPPGTPATPATPGTPAADTGGGGSSGLRIGSYAAFGVGVVGLAVGTVFLLKAGSKEDEADELCEKNKDAQGRCLVRVRPQVDDLDDQASSARTLSTVGFIAGGVGVAAGVTLFILSSGGSSEKTASRPRVEPWIGIGSAGVRGTF